MSNQPREETQLNPHTQRIHERWVSIRNTELKPLQFNIAHGLVLITCCAIFFAILRGCLRHSQTEQALALRIQEVGGVVTWEQRSFHSPESIVAVNFNRRMNNIDPGLLHEIVLLPRLRDLYLSNCALLDNDIVALRLPPSLTRLQLDNNPITDASVRHLVQFTNLEVIDLQGCAITNASLRFLGKCPRLWQIRLDDTMVSDPGLKSLSASTQLRILGLKRTQVSDAGVRYLHDLDRLVKLDLGGTSVSEVGIAELNAILPKKPANLTE